MELVINDISKIAIYNSLPFHYEMYGFILNYAKNTNRFVDIYSVDMYETEWLTFYKMMFKNFTIKSPEEYKPLNDYDYIFLTTDTDHSFNPEWFNDKVIVINHHYKIRNMYSHNYINVAKFNNSNLEYAIPCYPLCYHQEKINTNVISIVGGHEIVIYNTKYNIDIINRVRFKNQQPVELHFIARAIAKEQLKLLDPSFKIYIHENISTIEMANILKKSSYILLTFCNSEKKRDGKLASGSIQLAYNFLCKPIINSYTNTFLKLKGALEYNENSNELIMLDDVNFEEIEKARNTYIDYLPIAIDNLKRNLLIPKKIMQTWETKTLSKEFQQIVNSWKIYNPNYEYVFFDKNEREEFIKEYYDTEMLEVYQNIIPGAYKTDFFRYCYLYIMGGVYADIDTLCLGNLDKLMLPNINVIAAIDLNMNDVDGKHNIWNGFICTRPKNTIFYKCIIMILNNVKKYIIPESKLNFSGPGILGKAINIYLNNDPMKSFVGKEGLINDIFFLKFEPVTEYIKDIYGNIYLQNKNGNNMIIQLYENECRKIDDFQCWVKSNKIIRDNAIVRNLTNKHIALMMYGQFRSYKHNLRQNLLALRPILQDNFVHVFILTDKLPEGNYSIENEKEILDIFEKEFGYKVEFLSYIENYDMREEQKYVEDFNNTVKDRIGIENTFVPNLMYRKYLLNKLCNEYIDRNSIHIDLHFYARVFDTVYFYNNNPVIKNSLKKIKITIARLLDDHKNILFSADSLFICQRKALTDLFFPWNTDGSVRLFHDDIWNNSDINRDLYMHDALLVTLKHTYSPEIQYMCRMYHDKYNLRCIRIDHNNPVNIITDMLYNAINDPNRFAPKDYILNIDFSRDTIIKINEQTKDFINLTEYNEYLYILGSISYQAENCLIINIGLYNSADLIMLSRYHKANIGRVTIYSFDLFHNLHANVSDLLSEYPLKIFNENIYEKECLEKYKFALLSSKIITINICQNNRSNINNILDFLFENECKSFIIIKNNTYDWACVNEKFSKYQVVFNTLTDTSVLFLYYNIV